MPAIVATRGWSEGEFLLAPDRAVRLRDRTSPESSGFLCVCQPAGFAVVAGFLVAGPGSDVSEALAVGVGPAAPDFVVAPACPPGPVPARRSSASMIRHCRSRGSRPSGPGTTACGQSRPARPAARSRAPRRPRSRSGRSLPRRAADRAASVQLVEQPGSPGDHVVASLVQHRKNRGQGIGHDGVGLPGKCSHRGRRRRVDDIVLPPATTGQLRTRAAVVLVHNFRPPPGRSARSAARAGPYI
jgi:hypothetical protein